MPGSVKGTSGSFKIRLFVALCSVAFLGLIAFLFFANGGNTPPGYIPQCLNDSQCSQGYYCSGFGACLESYCGDGICNAQEGQGGYCPADCGCGSGQVLNRHLDQCQTVANVSDSGLASIVGDYLRQNNINGTIIAMNNTYYGNQTVKFVTVNCAPPNSMYPCRLIFFISDQGQVLNVTGTT